MKHKFEHGIIYHGDCLDLMQNIPDKSVDMVLADLPYGTTQNKWDTLIPFKPLWAEYKRIVKDNAAILLTASQPFTSALVMSNIEWFRYELIWKKNRITGFLDANKKPLVSHENILIFGEKRPQYYPIMKRGKLHKRGGKSPSRLSDNYGNFNPMIGDSNYYYPRSILTFNHDGILSVTKKHRPNKEKTHPTQKPVALFEYLIRTYTNKGDLVLDNVIGSGTTAVAAYNTGRRFIGIEKDQEIYNMAVKRIERDTKQKLMFAS